jgi:hypothetical protein
MEKSMVGSVEPFFVSSHQVVFPEGNRNAYPKPLFGLCKPLAWESMGWFQWIAKAIKDATIRQG